MGVGLSCPSHGLKVFLWSISVSDHEMMCAKRGTDGGREASGVAILLVFR